MQVGEQLELHANTQKYWSQLQSSSDPPDFVLSWTDVMAANG